MSLSDITPASPRYAVVVAKHHLRLMGASGSLGQKRQLAAWLLKMLRAADPGGLETRRDVRAVRRWLDLLNAADRVARTRANTWRTASVPPMEATAIAVDSAEFHARTLALLLRTASDEMLLYHKLAADGEIGRRGEVHRAAVAAECAARPWLMSEVGA